MATSVTVQIVRKPPDQGGFADHPCRWVVERFFRLDQPKPPPLEGPGATLASARAFLYAASILILI